VIDPRIRRQVPKRDVIRTSRKTVYQASNRSTSPTQACVIGVGAIIAKPTGSCVFGLEMLAPNKPRGFSALSLTPPAVALDGSRLLSR